MIASVRMPNGRTMRLQIEDHGAAVAVLPYDPVRRTAILVSQFRAPVMHVAGEQHMLEAVAGRLDDDDAQTAARREAAEEAGSLLEGLELVATAWSMPAASTERLTLFLAPYSARSRVGEGGGLDHELEEAHGGRNAAR